MQRLIRKILSFLPVAQLLFVNGRGKRKEVGWGFRFRNEISKYSVFTPLMFDMSEKNFVR